MANAKWADLTWEQVVDQIKQKHFSDLDADDYAFMAARQDSLSEADRRIYVEGEKPAEVLAEMGIPMTANERIIHENRTLQENERRIRDARNEALALETASTAHLSEEERSDAEVALDEKREEKFASLKEEVVTREKEEKQAAKDAEKADKEKKSAKAPTPVVVVSEDGTPKP